MALAALIALTAGLEFLNSGQESLRLVLWQWLPQLDAQVALYLDGLSFTMIMVVTGVGALIHLYAAGYMEDDPDYGRFFCYFNLFLAAMLVLVLADNLLLLYLGWEGVGLCSYLLIGFWYKDPNNGLAARKAFIVTRVGDTLMLLGLLLLYHQVGTLNISEVLDQARQQWQSGDPMVTLVALLLLGGAVGKSAQFPLHTWLPDAMAGPTPVSALIHAATMVTAGVYLIARLGPLYELSPIAMAVVAAIGAISALYGSLAALVQRDIKRILAYSTMSQIGYMFLALGIGSWYGAIFHLVCHAFFKALLFLTAGDIILRLHHKQNVFEMGGLYRELKLPFACFVIGSAALAALPLTAGFFSKEPIIAAAWLADGARLWWLFAIIGAMLTAFYCTRALVLVFFGEQHTAPGPLNLPTAVQQGMNFSLVILALLSLFGGYLQLPLTGQFLQDPALQPDGLVTPGVIHALQLAAAPIAIVLAWQVYGRLGHPPPLPPGQISKWHGWLLRGMDIDNLYDRLFVAPVTGLARRNRQDWIDRLPAAVVRWSSQGYATLSRLQQGSLRHYAQLMAIGLLLLLVAVELFNLAGGA